MVGTRCRRSNVLLAKSEAVCFPSQRLNRPAALCRGPRVEMPLKEVDGIDSGGRDEVGRERFRQRQRRRMRGDPYSRVDTSHVGGTSIRKLDRMWSIERHLDLQPQTLFQHRLARVGTVSRECYQAACLRSWRSCSSQSRASAPTSCTVIPRLPTPSLARPSPCTTRQGDNKPGTSCTMTSTESRVRQRTRRMARKKTAPTART